MSSPVIGRSVLQNESPLGLPGRGDGAHVFLYCSSRMNVRTIGMMRRLPFHLRQKCTPFCTCKFYLFNLLVS